MLRIVLDSAGDLPDGWAEKFEIETIPINIHFNEKTFLQGVDLSNSEFYDLVNKSGVIPKTSQPTPKQFIDFYEKIAIPGDDILSIHVTSKLSGTFTSASMAAKELSGRFNIIPIDSCAGTASQGYMCKEARELDRNDTSLNKIIGRMEYIAKNINVILTLGTLEYARMSGRVKALQAVFASILNVKPIIVLRDGILEMGAKVRTRRRALEYIVDQMLSRVEEQLVNVAVVHAEDHEDGNYLLETVKRKFNYKDVILTELSIGIAANLGPGAIGIVSYPVEECT
jgi:DegV family protein with EDD domain